MTPAHGGACLETRHRLFIFFFPRGTILPTTPLGYWAGAHPPSKVASLHRTPFGRSPAVPAGLFISRARYAQLCTGRLDAGAPAHVRPVYDNYGRQFEDSEPFAKRMTKQGLKTAVRVGHCTFIALAMRAIHSVMIVTHD
jgi:hypothetical protein